MMGYFCWAESDVVWRKLRARLCFIIDRVSYVSFDIWVLVLVLVLALAPHFSDLFVHLVDFMMTLHHNLLVLNDLIVQKLRI